MTGLKRLERDDGYATVTSAGIIAAVFGLLLVVAGLGAKVADSHRARVATDLAAVAAATAHYVGADACSAARRTAEANGATVRDCRMVGTDVEVTATVRASASTSRAGPL
ncbi:hypothetical protein CAPI_00755 [Corynebacterium capitovis DSM 44611]|uniref:Rv3654c family TadE-like protein n=1 Tax=Corynebacterium capitovis TaxID=131081 RepID=UPI00036EC844|nr:Rv3654c family TadE-like protein [Corynebacterium capitovis]WKD56730.1 hypothetical protein CAPI_00755 [Corynebacterium capitovis DSM 44611]